MKIYNTLTRQKQEFVPINKGEVKMYSCGPTVYDYFHIGNARPFIVFDTMRRYLEYQGYKVTFVQNFTDIDDKMIKRANEEGITVKELGERFIAEYFKDAQAIGIHKATIHPKATENIDAIINVVKKLVDNGYAYDVDGNVYFSTKKFNEYGKLSKQPLEDLEAGARIDVNEHKKDVMDFALWKKQKEGEPAWESPWGMGRPGWHIECSAMVNKYLGETIDIHSGGQDLIFPHHENEIAQSEAFLGHKWCPYWFHVLHLNDARGKMSKSKGGFLTVSLLEEKGYNPLVYRMFCLQSHYRKPLTFSYDNLDNTATAYNKLVKRISALSRDGEPDMAKAEELTKGFCEALDNDLNTSLALTCVYDVLKADADDATKLYVIGEFDKVLSLDLTKVPESNKADADDDFAKEVEELIAQRTKARAEKDWATADAIRDKLKEMKVVVKDTKDGIEWHVEG